MKHTTMEQVALCLIGMAMIVVAIKMLSMLFKLFEPKTQVPDISPTVLIARNEYERLNDTGLEVNDIVFQDDTKEYWKLVGLPATDENNWLMPL